MADGETLRVYDGQASAYVKLTKSDASSKPLSTFMNALPKGAHVLDFGCGPGHHAATMQSAGFHVDAWDGSAEMVATAMSLNGVQALQAEFSELDAAAEYDGIWASFSLLHATKADFAKHLSACHRALKPGGQLYIGMKIGTGEHRDKIGRYYSYYSQQELNDYLTSAGFTPVDNHSGSAKGLAGDHEPYVGIFARA